MTASAVAVFLVVVATLAIVQGWRTAGQRPRRRAGSRPRTRSTFGHDQWRRPGPRRKPRAIPGCDTYVYWPWNADGNGPDRSGRPKYVGKALNWRERRDEGGSCHRASSPWFPTAYPVPDVQRCADERAALAREWYLIGELDPTENERRPKGWHRTGRPTTETMTGFRLARNGLAYRTSTSTRRPPPRRLTNSLTHSTRASGRATSTPFTGRSWGSRSRLSSR